MLVTAPGERADEVHLHCGLAARERHAAAGGVVKRAIAADLVEEAVERNGAADDPQRVKCAGLGAATTGVAALARDAVAAPLNGIVWARRLAVTCAAAALRVESDLRLRTQRLRVLTPAAAQRAALEKH